MKEPQYIIERHQHGWIVKDPLLRSGVPFEALEKVAALAPQDAIVDIGLAGALKVVLVIGMPDECKLWREEHEQSIAHLSPSLRWLRGCDVGVSSLTIFVALIGDKIKEQEALHYYPSMFAPSTPRDAGDFGRCFRLLALLTPPWVPWEGQLSKVAERFPETKWKELAAEWPKLKELYQASKLEELSARLQEINQ